MSVCLCRCVFVCEGVCVRMWVCVCVEVGGCESAVVKVCCEGVCLCV